MIQDCGTKGKKSNRQYKGKQRIHPEKRKRKSGKAERGSLFGRSIKEVTLRIVGKRRGIRLSPHKRKSRKKKKKETSEDRRR